MRNALQTLAIALLIAFVSAVSGHADTTEDAWLAAAQILAADIDRHQTQEIHVTPGLHEVNPLYGPAPDNGRVNRVAWAVEAVTLGFAYAVPEYRTQVLGATLAVHLVGIANNRLRFGLSLGF